MGGTRASTSTEKNKGTAETLAASPLSNAFYGVLDYAAYPIGMLLVAGVVLRQIGTAEYGVWMVATATVSIGSIIASGFGDANILRLSEQRAAGELESLVSTVRVVMGIHQLLGVLLGAIVWACAPLLARNTTSTQPELFRQSLMCFRIAGVLIYARAVESVCISTQRAFQRYGAAVRISILARILSLGMAVLLVWNGFGPIAIMLVTVAITAAGLLWQLARLQALLECESLWPMFESATVRALLHFGFYSWVLAVAGVVFSQSDRLIGGAGLGAGAVVAYVLCAQIAQPIYGLTSAGLHFLFPYIAERRVTGGAESLRKSVGGAIAANVLLVACGSGLVLLFGDRILKELAGGALASNASGLLPMVVAGCAALGLGVTGTYIMMAFGRMRNVALLNVAGAMAMLLLMAVWLPEIGVRALATGRIAFGLVTLLVYIPLWVELRGSGTAEAIIAPQPTRASRVTAGEQAGLFRIDRPSANVLGIAVDALDMQRALARMKYALAERTKSYVCMVGVHGVMEAQNDSRLQAAYGDAMLCLPDGMPTVWVGQWQGHRGMQRVTGPDLMVEVFRGEEFAEYTHFLYGGKEGVAQELRATFLRRFPRATIVGTYTPPFRDLSSSEEEDLVARIGRLKPSIVWVGISTPRQELFMHRHLRMLDTTLMVGVGAAFDYHTGRIKDSPEWVKRAGLQWLHRLAQDPRRLLWRYARNNPAFLWKIAMQLAGVRMYPPAADPVIHKDVGVLAETGADLQV